MKYKIVEDAGRFFLYYNFELDNKGWRKHKDGFLTEDTALYWAAKISEDFKKKYGTVVNTGEF